MVEVDGWSAVDREHAEKGIEIFPHLAQDVRIPVEGRSTHLVERAKEVWRPAVA